MKVVNLQILRRLIRKTTPPQRTFNGRYIDSSQAEWFGELVEASKENPLIRRERDAYDALTQRFPS